MCSNGFPVMYTRQTGPCMTVFETKCSACNVILSYKAVTTHALQIHEYIVNQGDQQVFVRRLECSVCGVVGLG